MIVDVGRSQSSPSRRSLRALVGGLALAVALLCSLAIPGAYVIIEYNERTSLTSFKAQLNAARLAQYIYSHEQLWQYQTERLGEMIKLPQDDQAPLRQRIVDASGKLVLEEDVALQEPVIVRSVPIIVTGAVVGRVEVEQSLAPLLGEFVWVLLVCMALGAAAYLAFRFVPLRVIDRAFGELELQNARFDAAINNMSQGLTMFDGEQRLIVCNERYLQMHGLTREQLQSVTLAELLQLHFALGSAPTGRSLESFVAGALEATRSRVPWTRFTQLTDGRSVVINYRPIASGGWVTTHEDVTELRAAERRLTQAQADAERSALDARAAHVRLREAFDVVPEGLALFDAEDRLVLWNQRYLQLYPESADQTTFGVRFADVLKAGLERGMYPDARGREAAWLAARLERHARHENREEQKLPNGRWVRVEERRTVDGGSIGVRVDITELKQREEELKAQNLRFDTAINNMSQGLTMFDRDQRLVVCNRRYLEIYDLPPELARPGTPFQEIMLHRASSRFYAVESPEDYARELASSINDDLPLTRVVELRDGRAIVVKRQPMADGGRVATHEDITEQRRIEARIAHMAHHDALTDLANRVLFRERLEQALAHTGRGEDVAVLCMDLDRFKEVNDTLGHAMGDALLKIVAERLRASIREADIVARIGGDEFAILQPNAPQPASAEGLARRIIDAISRPYELEGQQVVLGTSVGVSVAPGDGRTPDQVLRNADLALYRAKGDGRGTYRFFEAGMDAAAQTRRRLELDLRTALATGAFELHYQPLVNLDRNQVSTFEALLRWNHAERGRVPPDEFIPLAEETGLIVEIGEWVLRQACAEAARWPDEVRVAVNLSAVQFNTGNIVELVSDALSDARLPPPRLELEITESALLENTELAFDTLCKLRKMGVRVALDDFGVGYSSLSYLRQFAFDKVKIDRSFIRDMATDLRSVAIIQTVIGLGASLDMVTVAEGVENSDQLHCLRAFGCTEVQGYFISQPKPAADVALLLTAIPAKTALAA